NQSSQFKAHAQREWENKTGLDFNHFIGGDINKKGTVTGGHSLTRGDVRVIQQTSAPDKHGVYQATVEIKKPDGSWEMKKGRGGKPMTNHSMFPKDWDEARIRAEVTSAWEKRKMVNQNKWEGKSSSGVWIEGFTTPRGTAYPIYGR
ncbi:TPA: EndoU domain-containing protein, partial [Neisseria lactamica]